MGSWFVVPTLDYKIGIIYSYSYHLRSNWGTFSRSVTGIFLVKLHFFHRLYLHWVHHRLWLYLPWRSPPVVGSLDWSRFMSSFFMENGRIMVVIPFYSLQKKIYKDIVSCSLKWVIFLFHGSTDFMNSWQHDAVEFPLMNEERELGVQYLLVLTPQKGGWCQFSMRIGSTCSAQVSLVYTPADLYLFTLLFQWQATTL